LQFCLCDRVSGYTVLLLSLNTEWVSFACLIFTNTLAVQSTLNVEVEDDAEEWEEVEVPDDVVKV